MSELHELIHVNPSTPSDPTFRGHTHFTGSGGHYTLFSVSRCENCGLPVIEPNAVELQGNPADLNLHYVSAEQFNLMSEQDVEFEGPEGDEWWCKNCVRRADQKTMNVEVVLEELLKHHTYHDDSRYDYVMGVAENALQHNKKLMNMVRVLCANIETKGLNPENLVAKVRELLGDS